MEPFWQKAIIALFETSFALVIAGFFAAWITSRAQRHRDASERREQLGLQMVEVANALYLQTQRHWRNRGPQWDPAPNQATAASRIALEEQYLKTRVAGEVTEDRLRTLFRSDTVWRHWHAVTDLLTVRYFQVIGDNGKASNGLLVQNAGPDHSGLTVEELANPRALLTAYRKRLRAASRAVFEEPIETRALNPGVHGRAHVEHEPLLGPE
ncbi:MAG TPA: hypothetical protein VKS22_08880 [Candidatus Binataceae bacterium]|nr:hypothetical protein [Candidatus Binataceae bacterium]